MAQKNKTKIYFWIKLDENFFKNLAIKNLRKTVTGGDTLVIIYQQMLLSSLANNGVIYYEGTLQDIAQEIALNLDEKLDDVRLAIDYFQKAGLLQIGDDGSAEMLQVPMLIGQETNWNKYKREKKLENFQLSSNQAPTDIEIDIDIEKEIDTNMSGKPDDVIPYSEILNYLNKKTERSFRNVEAHKKMIKARWNEGYKLEDFKTVIDNMVSNWSGKMFNGVPAENYLQPKTLFSNKFDSYLNQVPRVEQKETNQAYGDLGLPF